MPYGCGEQNMLNFAPNIYLLKFYFEINRITDEFLKRATDFMLAGKKLIIIVGDLIK